jgi:hypothetical protein
MTNNHIVISTGLKRRRKLPGPGHALIRVTIQGNEIQQRAAFAGFDGI